MFKEPGNGGMTGFVKGDGTFFVLGHDFGFLFQTTDDTVYRIQKVLFAYRIFLMTSCNQSSFITYISNVCPAETRGLTGQCIWVYGVV